MPGSNTTSSTQRPSLPAARAGRRRVLPLLACCGSALVAPAWYVDAAAAARVTAFPGPSWAFASPATELTFVGASAERLRGLTVVGSRTGRHEGRLRPLRVGAGAVFTPAAPFAPHERVTVELPVRVRLAGGRRYTFSVARPVAGNWKSPNAPELVVDAGRNRCSGRYRKLRTLAEPAPVRICLRRLPAFKPRAKKLLLAPRPRNDAGRRKPSLMIMSNTGKVFWYQPRTGVVHDLNAARYRGRPVLTYYLRARRGPDRHEILNRHYERIAQVVPGNGYTANAHELQLTHRASAYVGSYAPVQLRGGLKVTDFVMQEIDVPTGDVLFEWHALDHVPISATYAARPADGWAWDYFHGNSIAPPRRGGRTIIVSARKTSAVYGIDRLTGKVRWTLGGRRDTFDLPRALTFCAQHDVRRLPGGWISIFDNGGTALGGGCPRHRARAMRLAIDPAHRRVRAHRCVWSDRSGDGDDGLWPAAVGSARWQRDGDVLVDWGNTGRISEISRRGRVRFKLQLAHWTYRAVYSRWHGAPRGRPQVFARRAAGRTTVWASWNGHTGIRRWRILAGPTPPALAPGAVVRYANLETRISIESDPAVVSVEALDGRGRVLGTSRPATVQVVAHRPQRP